MNDAIAATTSSTCPLRTINAVVALLRSKLMFLLPPPPRLESTSRQGMGLTFIPHSQQLFETRD